MAALMLNADLAVSGGGQTTYELAATGTPAIGIRLAAGQALNLRGLSAAGCLREAGAPDEVGFEARLVSRLSELADDRSVREEMSRRGRALVDGRGAERVTDAIVRLSGVLAA